MGAVEGVPGGEGAVENVGFADGGEDVEEGFGGFEGAGGGSLLGHCGDSGGVRIEVDLERGGIGGGENIYLVGCES